MASEIRANTLKNRVGLGTVSFTNTGPVVSGIVTATSIEVVGAVGDNAARIKIPDGMNGSPFTGNLELGNSRDFVMLHDGHHNYVKSTQNMYVFCGGNNLVTLQTGGSVLLNKDLDVDGHTNLDNVNIAGVTTFSGDIETSKNIVLGDGSDANASINRLKFGGSGDLQIYHNQYHSKIVDSGTGALIISGSEIRFETEPSSTETLRIKSDGNVGIKSTAPRGKLDIQFDGAPSFITFGADADNPKVEFFRNTGGSPSHYATEIQMVLGDLVLSTAATANLGSHSYSEKLRIGSNGSVGIGTDYLSGNATVYHKLMVEGDTTSTIAVAKILRRNSSASNNTYTLQVDSSAHTSNMTTAGAMAVDVNSGRAFTINGNGYVGINQSSPSARLDVKQDNAIAYNGRAQSISYGAARFLNESAHQSGGTYTGFQFNITGDSQNRICAIGMISEASNTRNSSLVFATDDNSNRTEKVRITSGGRMGIGKSSDIACALHVYHATNNEQGRFESGDAYSHIVIKDSGSHATAPPYFGVQSNDFRWITHNGTSSSERLRLTSDGSLNIGNSSQSTHMLYLTSTGDAGIHIRADSDNSGESDNPYLSMAQDGGNTQQFKIGMIGSAGNEFAQSIANACFVHANNTNSQPLQLAHMDNMAVTISNTEQTHFHQTSGTAIGGMKIANRGNDTGAALILQAHNNTGTPGQATNTQLTHDGARFEFEIKHGSSRAIHVGNTRRIRMPGIVGVAGSGLVNVSVESDGNLCTTTSLREYKTNITSISDTSWLYNLNPVTFNWKKKTEVNGENVWEDTPDDNGTQYGLIAEEVEEVKKEFCYYDNDNKLSGVHYERLIAPLIKALQEQKAEIDALKTRVATLEGS